MTSGPRKRRAAALALSAALVLSACTGGESEPAAEAEESSAETSAPPTPGVPRGTEITEPGTDLAFGETASVLYRKKKTRTVLDLTVKSARKGSLKDFEGFILDDPYKKRGNYYYVQVQVKNAGKRKVGPFPVPLWGISGENTLLQPVEFRSAFKKCPTKNVPKNFKRNDKMTTCLVFLSPDKGRLEGVSYRPTEEFDPIEWRGEVKKPGQKKGSKKKAKKKGDKN